MKPNMIWAYLIHLSTNMWGEPGTPWPMAPWRDELTTHYETWRKVIDFLPSQGVNTLVIDVGDAIQYESHPEISIPGAWSKDMLKKELDYIRSIGLTPIPKLNFSACHDAWLKEYSRMLSTSIYYQVCEDLIREVAELFDYPEYFHLGMDEEWAQNKENMVVIRPKRIWWHDVNFLFGVCDKVGTRPWVWADHCWNTPDDYIKNMSKSAVQSNACYKTIEKNADGVYEKNEAQTYVKLEEAGFDQIPTISAVYRFYNAEQTMRLGKDDISNERLLGYMTCPWFYTEEQHYYSLMNDAFHFGIAKKKVYPEYI